MYHLESDVLAMQFGFGDETTPSTCCRSSGLGVIKTLLTENEELALSFGCAFDESCCGAPPYIKVNEEQRIRALFKRIVDADTLPNAIRDRVILDPKAERHDNPYASCHLPSIISAYYAQPRFSGSDR